MSLQVDYNRCIKCGKCLRDCVSDALVMTDNGPKYGKMGEKGCIKCQHCLMVCPVGAISIDNIDVDKLSAPKGVDYNSFEEISKVIRNRHSIRNFKSEQIEQKTIKKMLNELNYIASGCNCRSLKFIVVSNPEKLDELRKYFVEKIIYALDNKLIAGPIYNLFMSMKVEMLAGEDIFFRGAPHVLFVATHKNIICPEDAIIALSNFEIVANSLNYGTLWFGLGYMFFKYIDADFYKVLGLEEDYNLAYPMIFGKRNIEYARENSPEPYPIEFI